MGRGIEQVISARKKKENEEVKPTFLLTIVLQMLIEPREETVQPIVSNRHN